MSLRERILIAAHEDDGTEKDTITSFRTTPKFKAELTAAADRLRVSQSAMLAFAIREVLSQVSA